MSLHPYLFFTNTCRDAMSHYLRVLGGRLDVSMPWFDPDELCYQHMIGVNPRTSERESPLTDNRR